MFSDAALTVSVWNNLVIFDCSRMLEVFHVPEIKRAQDMVLSQHPHGVGLTLIRPGTQVPKGPVLKEMGKMMKELSGRIWWSIVVVEERGPLAALKRTVIRGLSVIAGGRIAAAATLEESLPLVLPHLRTLDGMPIASLQLAGTIRRAREAGATSTV